MLGKLIKYDFKAMAKMMIPVYIAMIVLTTLVSMAVAAHFDEGRLFVFVFVLFMVVLTGSIFVTLYACVKRFVNGLLKNEGYLSFALPVKTSTHILAKVLNALIWCVLEAAALGVCFAIMFMIVGGLKEAVEMTSEIFMRLDGSFWVMMIKSLILIALENAALICLIFAAYSVSHLFGKSSTVIAVAFIVLVLIIRGILLPARWISSLGEWPWYVMPVLTMALYNLLTWFILDRRLNLE